MTEHIVEILLVEDNPHDVKLALYAFKKNHLGNHTHVVRDGAEVVGCGALKRDPRGWGEVKRMVVRPEQRGRGIGKRLLAELEVIARNARLPLLRLETGIHNADAVALYRRAGFVECKAFGDYGPDPLSVFMEKRVGV